MFQVISQLIGNDTMREEFHVDARAFLTKRYPHLAADSAELLLGGDQERIVEAVTKELRESFHAVTGVGYLFFPLEAVIESVSPDQGPIGQELDLSITLQLQFWRHWGALNELLMRKVQVYFDGPQNSTTPAKVVDYETQPENSLLTLHVRTMPFLELGQWDVRVEGGGKMSKGGNNAFVTVE